MCTLKLVTADHWRSRRRQLFVGLERELGAEGCWGAGEVFRTQPTRGDLMRRELRKKRKRKRQTNKQANTQTQKPFWPLLPPTFRVFTRLPLADPIPEVSGKTTPGRTSILVAMVIIWYSPTTCITWFKIAASTGYVASPRKIVKVAWAS